MRLEFEGRPILVEFRPLLRAWRGKLVFGGDRGSEVHAGSFLRERRIVLDRALLRDARERDRILAHEILHFVWWRLGRGVRASWIKLLAGEFDAGVAGEMGWSADWRKDQLMGGANGTGGSNERRWKEYCCESFCDTIAMDVTGVVKHDEITLPLPFRKARVRWVEENLSGRSLRI